MRISSIIFVLISLLACSASEQDFPKQQRKSAETIENKNQAAHSSERKTVYFNKTKFTLEHLPLIQDDIVYDNDIKQSGRVTGRIYVIVNPEIKINFRDMELDVKAEHVTGKTFILTATKKEIDMFALYNRLTGRKGVIRVELQIDYSMRITRDEM